MPKLTVTTAAALLGSRGGKARAKALSPARRREIARMGGRPPRYRLTADGLERRDGDRWRLLTPPYDRAAREAVRRLQRAI